MRINEFVSDFLSEKKAKKKCSWALGSETTYIHQFVGILFK